jgi:hypothetical protein
VLTISKECVGSVQDLFFNESTEDVTQDEAPIDALIGAIIGSLELSSTYIRTMATASFALLSKAIRKSTVDLLLAVSQNQPTRQD